MIFNWLMLPFDFVLAISDAISRVIVKLQRHRDEQPLVASS